MCMHVLMYNAGYRGIDGNIILYRVDRNDGGHNVVVPNDLAIQLQDQPTQGANIGMCI